MLFSQGKEAFIKYFALFLSIIAFVFSVISLVGLSKLQNAVIENGSAQISRADGENNEESAGVEFVHVDGSTEKIKAVEESDKIATVIEDKVEKRKERNKKATKKLEALSKAKVVARADKNRQENNSKQENRKKKDIQQSKKPDVVVNGKQVDKAVQANGNFVVQIGSFNKKDGAINQCKKVEKYTNGKRCIVRQDVSGKYMSVIISFQNRGEAQTFGKNLSSKGISFLIKKNS